jgi:LysM repeat protein
MAMKKMFWFAWVCVAIVWAMTPNLKANEEIYTVHYGDTLSEIAESHSTSVHDILSNNPGSSEVIHEGQKLRIVTYEKQ